MVHALEEARRVLKSGGILIDLRPAPAHRRIGIGEGRSWRLVASLHELLDNDYAANAAVADVLRRGLFRTERRMHFILDRVLDTPDELRDFIKDLEQRRDSPSFTTLVDMLEQRYDHLRKPRKVSVRGPMHLAVLRKLPAAPRTGK